MELYFFSFLGKWQYLGLFLVLLAAGLGLPLPEDVPLLAAGWLVYEGQGELWLMMLVGLAGVMVGDTILFSMGRKYGTHIVEHRWLHKIARPWMLEKARQLYKHHGAKVLFAARFMPGLRGVLFMTAGVFHVPYWKFWAIDGTAALISVPLWVWVGARFSGSIKAILGGTRVAGYILVGALVVAVVVWLLWEHAQNVKKDRLVTAANPLEEEIRSAPLVGSSGEAVKGEKGVKV